MARPASRLLNLIWAAVGLVLVLVRRLRARLTCLLWGGDLRERLLITLLRRNYDSLLVRQWSNAENLPHFFDHRIGSFAFATGNGTPFGYYRAYFAAEVVHFRDRLLDIGCGDGFFDRRFFSPKCALIDAIDIEPSAIEHASHYNAAPNINYVLLDAVEEPFPHDRYDVIVWDGGLGHFAPETTDHVIRKISANLADGGVFVGSESLGREGHDHLQFFASVDDLCRLLRDHFPHVEIRRIEYEIPGSIRREAYWRCAIDPTRLREASWRACGDHRD